MMEGRLCRLDIKQKCGKVDTRNDAYGILTIYFKNIPSNLTINSTVEFDVAISKCGKAYAKFVSVVGRNEVQFNTEDRDKWYDFGEGQERDFLAVICRVTGRDIRRNPEKESSPWAIDLYDYTMQKPADLKTQHTPFFTAEKYSPQGIQYAPAFTVTFNKKDYENYRINYPSCDIYFWVDWKQLEYGKIKIPYVYGVWRASFLKMAEKIQNNQVALHQYIHRKDDDHNAKDSFLFDLRDHSLFERLL